MPDEHDPLAILGFGGHGREILQCLRRSWDSQHVPGTLNVTIYDATRPSSALLVRHGVTWGGDFPVAGSLSYIGIGDGLTRLRLHPRLRGGPPVVDPSAVVGSTVEIGEGTIVFALASVTVDIVLGRHVHIGRGAAIGHNSRLADCVTVMPLASISGNVHVGEASTVGTGASVRQGVRIGSRVFVGMGAVVLNDIPDDTVVVGNPAHPIT